jgi:hypothetical protein
MKLLNITFLSLLLGLFSCQKGVNYQFPANPVEINIQHNVGDQPLAFNVPYQTLKGEDFTVTTFKYYISNIALYDGAGHTYSLPNEYFLVDQDKPDSRTIRFQTDGETFAGLRFMIGVDSIRNVSGAQTGALDPALEMFWTWNSGYIMAKLEGTSSLSNLPNHRIEYHIGGYAGPDKATRIITLPFGQIYHANPKSTFTIHLTANLLAWFSSVNDLRIQTTPACTTPGPLAHAYADNYSHLFSITSLQTQ